MEKMEFFSEISPLQAKVELDLMQTYQAYVQALCRGKSYTGGMSWKKQNGAEYLIRLTGRDGRGKSLGRRSEQTETLYGNFYAQKQTMVDRVATLKNALSDHASMARSIKLGRVPVIVADVLRVAEDEGVLGKNLMVIGTHALYAFEASAGVRFDANLMATTDIDFLWDARSKLVFADPVGDFAVGGLLALIKRVDASFEPVAHTPYSAVNKNGFYVDLVKTSPNPPWKLNEPEKMAPHDLTPAWIDEVKWFVASEKFTAYAIDQRGMPVKIVCPDPRVFALYKAWLSQQDSRDPKKRQRDLLQSRAVADLLVKHLSHLKFTDSELRMFPALAFKDALSALGR